MYLNPIRNSPIMNMISIDYSHATTIFASPVGNLVPILIHILIVGDYSFFWMTFFLCVPSHLDKSMGKRKKDITPVRLQRSYIFLALAHRNVIQGYILFQ